MENTAYELNHLKIVAKSNDSQMQRKKTSSITRRYDYGERKGKMDTEMNLVNQLVAKSKEAFIMGIEIYNKPTIKYRVEGFSFFICNAWELMLKAYLVKTKGNESIYYPDKPDRTLSLDVCIRKVFTNNKDPLRVNLERIIDLRNMSTHFITEEYEQIYIPLFQACVLNYSNKLLDFFGIDITEDLSSNFLTLSVKLSSIKDSEILARYPKEVADKLLNTFDKITSSIDSTPNPTYAIQVRHEWYLTKKPKEAALSFTFTNDASKAAKIIKQPKDMHKIYPYTMKDCVKLINQFIKRNNLQFINPTPSSANNDFNKYHFNLFVGFYDIKADSNYCYEFTINKLTHFCYNQKLIEFICESIKKDPTNIIKNLKEAIAKK